MTERELLYWLQGFLKEKGSLHARHLETVALKIDEVLNHGTYTGCGTGSITVTGMTPSFVVTSTNEDYEN